MGKLVLNIFVVIFDCFKLICCVFLVIKGFCKFDVVFELY